MNLMKEKRFSIKIAKTAASFTGTITASNNVENRPLLENVPAQSENMLQSLEQAARKMGK